MGNTGNDTFATGSAAEVRHQTSVYTGGGSNTAIRLENGAAGIGNSTKILNANIGVHIPNIGAASHLKFTLLGIANTTTNNYLIQHPGADGYVAGSGDITQMSINASSTVKFNIVDNDPASSIGLTVVGDIYQGAKIGTIQNVSDFAREGVVAGLVDSANGVLSQGTNPLDLDVAAGKAYVIDNLNLEYIHTWTATTLTVPDNSKYYVTVNSAGTLQLESGLPGNPELRALLGYVVSLGGVLVAISNSFERADHPDNHMSLKDRNVNGAQYASGSLVTENVGTAYALDVSPGEYWYGMRQFLPAGITAGNFRLLYRDGLGGTTLGSLVSLVPSNLYDDGSGTLASVPAGKYVKHALVIVGDGTEEQYMLVYGQAYYNNLGLAQAAALPVMPSFVEESITTIASIIVHEGDANITEIKSERRLSGFAGSAGAVVTDHGSLTGLADNDHPQYLLRDGSNAMTADLNMGGFTLTNIGSALPGTTTAAPVAQTPDQANAEGISTHKARADHVHNIPTATPVTIGTSNQQGTAATFARSDHVHSHGNLGGGSTHALATGSVHGFLSSSDFTKINQVTTAEVGYLAGVTSAIQTQFGGKAASGANTDITSLILNQTGLTVKGATSVALTIKPDETLTVARTLSIITGDADRTLTITGNASISGTHTGTSSGTNTGDQTITLSGDVTGSGTSSFVATIAAGVVSNTKLANVATATFKGRTTAGTGSPEDLSVGQATALLNVMVGDTGSGGTKGLVPAPAAGDAAKFLRGDGTWVANASGTVTVVSIVTANGFAGTVANDSTTPAITLTTSITGILQGNGTAISAATTTGTGNVVLATSPTLVTPTLGVASATSINKVAITAPATGSTLTIADGKTLTASNTLTFTGTDTASIAFGAGGTVVYTSNTLAVFAATTSAQLAGVISDETGSGSLVFATSPTLVTPTLGVATATSINKIAFTAPLTGATLTIADGKTLTASNTMTLTATDGSTIAFGTGGTVAYQGGTLAQFAATTSAQLAGIISDETGSGALVFATSPTLVTPTLGVASATSINKVAITAPATSATFTIADGKTLTVSNTLTFTGTDTSSIAFGAGGTVAYTANTLAVFAATTSAQLAGVISDETGSGSLVFATSPTLTTPNIGVATATSVNKVAITAPTTSATLTLADGSTLASSGAFSLTLTTTAATNVTFPTSGVLQSTAPRIQSVTSSATVTPDATANDMVIITAQAAGLTLANPSGASNQGQKLIVRIKDNGTARAITYGTEYRALGNALPATTVISKTLYLGFIRNSTDTKWDLVALSQEA